MPCHESHNTFSIPPLPLIVTSLIIRDQKFFLPIYPKGVRIKPITLEVHPIRVVHDYGSAALFFGDKSGQAEMTSLQFMRSSFCNWAKARFSKLIEQHPFDQERVGTNVTFPRITLQTFTLKQTRSRNVNERPGALYQMPIWSR
jgi:hypothetical protein